MRSVATTSGELVVEVDGDLLHARGVPYATAARFEPPQPSASPGRRLDATRRGPACPQEPSRLDRVNGPVVDELAQSEDCLVLSVVVPVAAADLPVMVWFHGGAYLSGSGEAPKYDADGLARRGVVVVTVTSRLGAFGYLAPDDAGPDNLGLLDQLAALRWVHANIAAFGGDPAATTIFGQSAGGDSVLMLLASPAARGLVRRAIVQSAPLGLRSDAEDARAARDRMTAAMRATVADHLPAARTAASSADVLAAQRAALATAQGHGRASGLAFGPVVGAEPVAATLQEGWRESAPLVDLLIGSTKDDAAPFVQMSAAVARLGRLGVVGRLATRLITRRVTAGLFGRPADDVARRWRQLGGRATTYRFDWSPDGGGPFGATHCIELPFLFSGDWSDAPMLAGRPVPPDVASRVQEAWVGFARSGTDHFADSAVSFSAT